MRFFFLGCVGSLVLMVTGCPSTSQSIKGSHQNSATSTPISQPRTKVRSATGVGMILSPTKTAISLGKSIFVLIKNTGKKTYRYSFKGGSNGCVLPIYRMTLIHQSGQRFVATHPRIGRKCTMALVPPRKIVLRTGQSLKLKLDTGRYWYIPAKSLRARAKPSALPVGSYRLHVRGGGLRLSFNKLTIQR